MIEIEGRSCKWRVTTPGFLSWAGQEGEHGGLVWKLWLSGDLLSTRSFFTRLLVTEERGKRDDWRLGDG